MSKMTGHTSTRLRFSNAIQLAITSVMLMSHQVEGGKTTTTTTVNASTTTTTTTTTDPYAELWAVTALLALAGAGLAILMIVMAISWWYTYNEYQQMDFQYPKDRDFALLLINDALNRRLKFC